MKKFSLEITVFVCGAATMTLELVGSRIVAPYVGTSIFVWTNLIGVILLFLSMGYWLGGRMADRHASARSLSALIFVSGLWIFGLAWVHDGVLISLAKIFLDVRVAAFFAALALFGIPAILLGMVTPYAVRLKMAKIEESGRTVGNLYALSTIGSIAGTFITGLFLLSYFGHTLILYGLGAVLWIAAWIATGAQAKPGMILGAFLAIGALFSQQLLAASAVPGVADHDTAYSRVWIYDIPLADKTDFVRVMQIADEKSSLAFLKKQDLVSPYTKYYRLGEHFNPGMKRTLMIGGAGYSYPKEFAEKFPDRIMDVVEIDPGVTELAEKYFSLKEYPNLKIFHEDARTYLNRSGEKYDVIYSDAFRSTFVPFHLTTLEIIAKIHDALNEDGIFMANVVGSIEGPGGRFLRSEIATLKKIFPQIYIFCVEDREDGAKIQNLMVIALKSKKTPKFYSSNAEYHQYLQNLWIQPVPEDMRALSDDFAPTDFYSLDLLTLLKRSYGMFEARDKSKRPSLVDRDVLKG